MPDITKCTNEKCPQKETCYRWTSIADTYQSYVLFEFDDGCEFYYEKEKI